MWITSTCNAPLICFLAGYGKAGDERMDNMKKRSFGVLLILVLTLMLLTTAALAADYTLNDEYVKDHPLSWDTNGVELRGGNTYKLEGNLTLDGKFLRVDASSTGYNVTLDLKGHTLTIQNPVSITNHKYFGVFFYDQQGKEQREQSPIGILFYNSPNENATAVSLTLTDSVGGGKLNIEGTGAEDAIGIYVGRNCTLNIEGGTITNSTTDKGQTYTATGVKTVLGTVNMTGGCIEKQYTGVELSGGTFSMSKSAEIADCGYLDADGNPQGYSGVWAYTGYNGKTDSESAQTSTLTMDGGTIKNCMNIAAGGGVQLDGGGTFTMTNGTITGCKAGEGRIASSGYSGGGSVYVGNGTFTMSGGTISNCEAANHGGGVYVCGTFNMSGTAKITGCTARAGGGVSANEPLDTATFTMSGNAEITGCKADGGCGGGAYIGKCKFTMSDNAKITNCTAAENTGYVKDGDCIMIESADSATLDIADSVTISGQITQRFGGIRIDGLGTAKYPYQIGTKDELVLFGSIVNGTADTDIPAQRGACAELTKDIDLENEAWTPIGQSTGNSPDDDLAYSGTFNGNGHTISGLNVTGDFNYFGLFGYTEGAAIRDLTVAGKVTSTSTDSSTAVGGIIGRAKASTIENCGNLCAVTAPAGHTGGIVGYAAYMDDSSGWITGCYNAGEISGGDYAGGIVGTCYDVFIYDCYNVGPVSGNRAIGGIAGSSGLVMLFNCYNAGTAVCPDGTATPGGLFGSGSGQVRNSYCLKGTTADSHIGAIEKSAEEFADGTVLKALKDGKHKSKDPWADECQYVDAAGLTLPVFKNQNTHKHQLDHVEAKEPTTGADGNIEYWYCPICGKYFADANGDQEITLADTVRERLPRTGSRFTYSSITAEAGKNGSVSPSGETSVRDGNSQTFVFTPDKGYRVKDVLIDGRSVGALRSYTFATVRRNHTVEVTFEKIPAFTDVPASAYYADAVDWALENWITEGTSDTRFSPDAPCTRAQAVTFLWRAAGCPAPSSYKMPFEDVKSGSYYETAVLWAVENGITKGTSDTTFSPDQNCTRAQIVSFLWRSEKSPAARSSNPFTDVSGNAYYLDAVLWAVKENITRGTSSTTFSPDSPCTRAQIVTFLWRCKA